MEAVSLEVMNVPYTPVFLEVIKVFSFGGCDLGGLNVAYITTVDVYNHQSFGGYEPWRL